MSVSAVLSIKLRQFDEKKTSPQYLISAFISEKWRIYNDNKVIYLPLNDTELEWVCEYISEDNFWDIIKKKCECGEPIGVLLFWENTDIGIDMIIYPEFNLTISLNINRKKIIDGIIFTDINWYIKRIFPILHKFGYIVESFSYEEY